MHSINIIHRDLKPQNILVDGERAKVADFSRSVQLKNGQQRLKGSEGTYHFKDPEVLVEKEEGGFDGKAADIWALGVTAYCVVFDRLPFHAEFLPELFERIEQGKYFDTKAGFNSLSTQAGVILSRK